MFSYYETPLVPIVTWKYKDIYRLGMVGKYGWGIEEEVVRRDRKKRDCSPPSLIYISLPPI
jgi:hypothetical protein